jgi:AraC-like DNA-binding protein
LLADPGSRAPAAAWAARFGLTTKTLARRFRSDLQMTFGAWRRAARIAIARRRLAAGEAVTSVAIDLGYESVSAFTAMFRRVTGTTPSDAKKTRCARMLRS